MRLCIDSLGDSGTHSWLSWLLSPCQRVALPIPPMRPYLLTSHCVPTHTHTHTPPCPAILSPRGSCADPHPPTTFTCARRCESWAHPLPARCYFLKVMLGATYGGNRYRLGRGNMTVFSMDLGTAGAQPAPRLDVWSSAAGYSDFAQVRSAPRGGCSATHPPPVVSLGRSKKNWGGGGGRKIYAVQGQFLMLVANTDDPCCCCR